MKRRIVIASKPSMTFAQAKKIAPSFLFPFFEKADSVRHLRYLVTVWVLDDCERDGKTFLTSLQQEQLSRFLNATQESK
jgi:hypothetical protein